jgi:hypothetical protein
MGFLQLLRPVTPVYHSGSGHHSLMPRFRSLLPMWYPYANASSAVMTKGARNIGIPIAHRKNSSILSTSRFRAQRSLAMLL